VERYENWQKLKDAAIANADPKKKDSIAKMEYPEPPPPLDESEIADVTLDLSQAAIEAEVSHQELDLSGMERVPDADPGLDVRSSLLEFIHGDLSTCSNLILKWEVARLRKQQLEGNLVSAHTCDGRAYFQVSYFRCCHNVY
jgi:hypothetical protein